jgi:hypothetical protein
MTNEQQALERFRAAHAGDLTPFAPVTDTGPANFGVMITHFTPHGPLNVFAVRRLMDDRTKRPQPWRGTRQEAEGLARRMRRIAEHSGIKNVTHNVAEIISEGGL